MLTRIHVQESISCVVDLPDDDPYILEQLLQFLYTGNYEDGEYPVLNKASSSATMTPEEVLEELDQAPGIDAMGASDGHGGVPETQSQDPTHASEERNDESDDGDYVPEEDDEDEDKEQSEIEYNEFDESGGDDTVANLAVSPQVHRIDWPHTLFTSLRVYVMADKFDVPALKLLARERFYRTAENIYMTCEDFPAVVDEMYRSTPPTDVAMREIPCRLIANQYGLENALRERIVPVMREHGDLAVGVLHYVVNFYWGFGSSPSKDDDNTSP